MYYNSASELLFNQEVHGIHTIRTIAALVLSSTTAALALLLVQTHVVIKENDICTHEIGNCHVDRIRPPDDMNVLVPQGSREKLKPLGRIIYEKDIHVMNSDL